MDAEAATVATSTLKRDQAFSLLSRTGWNSAVAFLSSAAGSAPLIMLVSAMPNVSRNSVTGTMMGRPGIAILTEPSMQSTHALRVLSAAIASASANAEMRTGAPAAASSIRAWFFLFDAHCRNSQAGPFLVEKLEIPSPSPNMADTCCFGPGGITPYPTLPTILDFVG